MNRKNNFIILLVVLLYFIVPQTGYVWNGPLQGHFIYPFCHANIFHLLGNCFCLWLFKDTLNYNAWLIAILCSFCPCFIDTPTYGMSGVLFAHIGINWGRVNGFSTMCRRVLPLTILCGLLPNMNMMIHIYCLFVAYFFTIISRRYA